MTAMAHTHAAGAPRKGIASHLAGWLLLLSLTGCAALNTGPKATGIHAERQSARIHQASLQLEALNTVDMVLTFDNAVLAPQLRELMARSFAGIPGWSGDKVTVSFLAGYIALEVRGSFELTPDNPVPVSVSGELVPYLQPDALSWHASLYDLQFEGQADDRAATLERLQTLLQEAMAEDARRSFELNPMPLGILETGIRLRSPLELVQSESSALEGLLTIAGSATLIQAGETRIAVDLGFIPIPAECTGTVQIGRATFARDVQNREPVAPAAGQSPPEQARVFFTDVLNAGSPTTVIHYWFADGQPVSITELGVEPSARWRTWSAAPEEATSSSNWQVLVVEKRTGCVLAHRSLHVGRPPPADENTQDSNAAFPGLAAEFTARTADHESDLSASDSVVVSVDRRFFSSALSEAMYNLRLVSTSQIDKSRPFQINAQVGAVPADTLSCNRQSCDSQRVCTLDFDNCPVQSDTRDCTSCLLRNPLNNRCIREAEDPICLGARENENLRLETNRQACIARETKLRDACVLNRERELERCNARVNREVSSCASQLAEMASRYASASPIAELQGSATLSGSMTFEFSEFRLDEDLERIRMVLSLDSNLVADTRVDFKAATGLNMLAGCVQETSDDYQAPLALPLWQGGLVSEVGIGGTSLLAEWSGLIQHLESDPTPIAQFFASNPDALTSCDIGLDSDQLLSTLSGVGTDVLLGVFDLDMQPEPTRITLLPAYLSIADQTWLGDPQIGDRTISYRLGAGNREQ